jgi:hypothetical protein
MKHVNSTLVLAALAVSSFAQAKSAAKTPSTVIEAKGAGIMGIIPGEDPSAALLLGQGQHTIFLEAMGHCVDLGDLRTQSGQETGQVAEFQIQEIRSETDMRNSMGLSATVSMIGYLLGNPGGRLSFVQQTRIHSEHRYLLIKSRVGNQLEIASRFSFTPDVQEYLEWSDKDEAGFVSNCGNEFVYARRTGVEFYAVIEFITDTYEQGRNFDAAAEGTYNGWRGVLDFNADLERFSGISETRVRMLQLGGARPFPAIEDMEDFAREYPTLVDTSREGQVTLELVSKNYGGVAPLRLQPNLAQTRARSAAVEELSRNREKLEDTRRTMEYIRQNLNAYNYDRNKHDFTRWAMELRSFQDTNDDIARDCLTGRWDGCVVPPTHKLPFIEFPTRKIR